MNVKNRDIWIFLVALATVGGIVATSKIVKKQSTIKQIVSFIKKWEGGLSRALTDTASRVPAPWMYEGVTGWHTNMGITYQTFSSLATKIGYPVTPKNFFQMSKRLWYKILLEGFMMAYPLYRIKHLPRIQAVIITWAWGSGLSGSERRLANFQRDEMGIVDSNITKTEIVNNFLKRINRKNERNWFLKLCNRREADFRRMSTFNENGVGWLRRLDDFKITFG